MSGFAVALSGLGIILIGVLLDIVPSGEVSLALCAALVLLAGVERYVGGLVGRAAVFAVRLLVTTFTVGIGVIVVYAFGSGVRAWLRGRGFFL